MENTEVKQSVKQTKQGRRVERRQENQRKEQEQKRAARNRRITVLGSLVVAALVIIGVVVVSFVNSHNSTKSSAPAAVTADTSHSVAPVVDNIACEVNEQVSYHIHAHVSIYINGQQQNIPANVGINQQQGCYYWLHTHDTTGVIHIEAPQPIIYTLGNFFHIWGQQFAQSQYPIELSDTNGWQVYVDGKAYKGDFNNIPMNAHTLITMAYNSPKAPIDTVYNWSGL
jgi:uncharacterized protein (UPF0333 family)